MMDLAEIIEAKMEMRARNRGRMMHRCGESIPLQPPRWIARALMAQGRLASARRVSCETEGWRIEAADVDPRADTARIVRRGRRTA